MRNLTLKMRAPWSFSVGCFKPCCQWYCEKGGNEIYAFIAGIHHLLPTALPLLAFAPTDLLPFGLSPDPDCHQAHNPATHGAADVCFVGSIGGHVSQMPKKWCCRRSSRWCHLQCWWKEEIKFILFFFSFMARQSWWCLCSLSTSGPRMFGWQP